MAGGGGGAAASANAKVLIERTPAHRLYRWISWGIGLLVALALPYIPLPEDWFGNEVGRTQNWNRALAMAVAIVGLNLLIGFSGQISIGHSAFIGLGAYTTIVLVATHHWSYFVALPFAFIIPFIAGCIIGLPALRIKGLYLVIVTFAMAIAFPTVILRYESVTGGSNGKGADGTLEPATWTPFDGERVGGHRYRYYILLIVAATMFLLATNMIKSRAGRSLVASRDNPTAATVSGVSVPLNKVLMFGVSAGFCGVAGWMLMVNTPFAADTSFGVALGISLIIGLVIGGAATVSGAIPGALVIVVLQYVLEHITDRPKIGPVSMGWLATRQGKGGIVGIALGILLLASVFILPGGIIDGIRRLRGRFVRTVPNPRWLAEIRPSEL